MKSTATLLAALLLLAGCGHRLQESAPTTSTTGGSTGGTQANILVKGSVEEGPFVLGSSITVSEIDATGNPTGATFNAQTTDDLGQFSVSVAYSGPVSIEAQGYYFDELAGDVSTSTLTLQGIGALPTSGSAQVNVNVLTHLISGRVTHLMAAGQTVQAASAQAQAELVTALGLGGAGFTLSEPATTTSLAAGNTPDDAYLLAVSVLFMQVARTNAGADQVTATLQEGLNNARAAFASDGTLPSDTVNALHQAETVVEPDAIRAALSTRYAASVSGCAVPNVDEILDSDLDGVPNALDACPLVASDGGAANGICSYRHSTGPATWPNGSAWFVIGDFDGDGTPDIVQSMFTGGGTFWHGLGGGTMAAPTSTVTENFIGYAAADVDGDGKLDLLGSGNLSLTTILPQYAAWVPGFGDGGFGDMQAVIPTNVALPSPDADGGVGTFQCSGRFQLADLDGDGRQDAVAPCTENEDLATQANAVLIAMRLGDGGFDVPTRLDLPIDIAVSGVDIADFDGDGKIDIVVGSCGNEGCGGEVGSWWTPSGGLWIARGHGDGTFTVEALTTALGPIYPNLPMADVNGDGKPDLVVGYETTAGPSAIDVLINDGTGHFAVDGAYHLEGIPELSYNPVPQLYDFTGDGRLDLTLGLTVIPSQPGGWGTPQSIVISEQSTPGGGYFAFAVGDLDGDGHPDLAGLMEVTSPGQTGSTPELITVVVNPAGWHSW
ncbi:MAG: VCBS repeat-containing protein [Deltaproteobacteria bacterium]|nr:VCBS repeat-containing protein [Deltaproteobacteria bacterium]